MGEGDSVMGVHDLRVIGEYQFGRGAGGALFPRKDPVTIERSRTGRPRQILASGDRIVSFTTNGQFTLGLEGGYRLHQFLDYPGYRVVVGNESDPFVREGRNVFAKFVEDVDPVIRPVDEVLVVTEQEELLGVGRAELSADAMLAFESGMAVKVREGIGK